jgi:hypothetical protein
MNYPAFAKAFPVWRLPCVAPRVPSIAPGAADGAKQGLSSALHLVLRSQPLRDEGGFQLAIPDTPCYIQNRCECAGGVSPAGNRLACYS